MAVKPLTEIDKKVLEILRKKHRIADIANMLGDKTDACHKTSYRLQKLKNRELAICCKRKRWYKLKDKVLDDTKKK